MPRPAGSIPIIATTETFNDPADAAKPWYLQPTKVEPSGGLLAAGFKPDADIDVEHIHYLLNKLARHVEAFDLAQYMNWTDRNVTLDLTTAGGNTTGKLLRFPFPTEGYPLVHVANGDRTQISYDEGYGWADDYAPLGGSTFVGAVGVDAVLLSYVVGGTGRTAKRGEGGGWGVESPAGMVTPWAATYDKWEECFIVVGERAATAPGIWTITADGGSTPSTITTQHPASGTYAVKSVAAGPTSKLAARDGVTLLRWVAGATSSSVVTPTPNGTESIKDIVYNEEHGAFFLISSDGAGQTSVFKSVDGSAGTWTLVWQEVTGVTADTRNGDVHGGCVFFVIERGTDRRWILTSFDGGTTWHQLPDPVQGTASTHNVSRVSAVGNRIAAYDYTSGGVVQIALSLRAGLPLG